MSNIKRPLYRSISSVFLIFTILFLGICSILGNSSFAWEMITDSWSILPPSDTANCWRLSINGNAWVGIGGNSYTWTINENVWAWAMIWSFDITCTNGSAPYTYSLVDGLWSDDNAIFAISWGSLIANFVPNSLVKSLYTIRVRSLDSSGMHVDNQFTVIVLPLNLPPAPTPTATGAGDEVMGITIKTQPDLISYTIGNQLDITGLVVTLTKSDGSTEDVAWNNFVNKWITTSISNWATLNKNDKTFTISANWHSKNQKIFVDPVWSSIVNVMDIDAEKDNLIIITHGVCGSAYNRPSNPTWMTKMRNDIYKNINSENTVIRLYDWKEDADSPTCDNLHFSANPLAAYWNAAQHWEFLFNQIKESALYHSHTYSNIHLIAHSAWTNLIQKTVDNLSKFYHDKWIAPQNAPKIHLTFLDAYIPNGDDKKTFGDLSNGQSDYSLLGYAEQYVDTMDHLMDTNIKLLKATNFDVTYLTSESNRSHTWPIDFYNNWIINSEYTLPLSNSKNAFSIGFRLSKESLNSINYDSAKNYLWKWCVVTNVSEPYRRCLDNSTEDNRDVIITDPDKPANISLDSWKWIDVSQFISHGTGILPQMTIDTPIATVDIPNHVTITSSNPNWNGIITAPKTSEILNIQIKDWKVDYTAIEVGFSDAKLTFNKAVKISLPWQAGKRAGYKRPGINFTEINNICVSSWDQVRINADLIGSKEDCKINEGGDMLIWTKHFTTFAAYEEAPAITSWWGGGGWTYIPTTVSPIAFTGQAVSTGGAVVPVSIVIIAKDIKRSFYRDAINTLIFNGIIANSPFIYPNRFISRAEFIKVLAKTNGFTPVSSSKKFADVESSSDFAQYISFAVEKGWINTSNENFRPNAYITQGEVDKLIVTVQWKISANKKIGASRFVTRGKAMKDIVDAFFGK